MRTAEIINSGKGHIEGEFLMMQMRQKQYKFYRSFKKKDF